MVSFWVLRRPWILGGARDCLVELAGVGAAEGGYDDARDGVGVEVQGVVRASFEGDGIGLGDDLRDVAALSRHGGHGE